MTKRKEQVNPTRADNIFKKMASAPTEMKLFMFFALATVITQFVVMFFCPFEIRLAYAEKMGVSTSGSYMFSLIFVFLPISSDFKIRLAVIRWGILSPLIFGVFLCCLMYLNIIHDGGRFIKSGYWGLVWSVVIPILWTLLILLSPRINKFYENLSNSVVNPVSGFK
ncbi:hypothetical protein ESA94_01795 [Lacibacter luteus]|uniref:Uncharacterized protein n=1 Tax=Lacibacter luteus TaxID=2508719 RepID=A0A4Q1CMC4_9BACT|nr:hypothetical protein [Lacibacter luteus]RXK61769.1 hypothetical protein ESA94_01795 [Lacibacter luteus]